MEYAIRYDDVSRFLRCKIGETLETMGQWLRPVPVLDTNDSGIADVLGYALWSYLEEHDADKTARSMLRDALYEAGNELYSRDGFEVPATLLGVLALRMVCRIAHRCLALGDLDFVEVMPGGVRITSDVSRGKLAETAFELEAILEDVSPVDVRAFDRPEDLKSFVDLKMWSNMETVSATASRLCEIALK